MIPRFRNLDVNFTYRQPLFTLALYMFTTFVIHFTNCKRKCNKRQHIHVITELDILLYHIIYSCWLVLQVGNIIILIVPGNYPSRKGAGANKNQYNGGFIMVKSISPLINISNIVMSHVNIKCLLDCITV